MNADSNISSELKRIVCFDSMSTATKVIKKDDESTMETSATDAQPAATNAELPASTTGEYLSNCSMKTPTNANLLPPLSFCHCRKLELSPPRRCK